MIEYIYLFKKESFMVDRCICCGCIIPEGRMVCPDCMDKTIEQKDGSEPIIIPETTEIIQKKHFRGRLFGNKLKNT